MIKFPKKRKGKAKNKIVDENFIVYSLDDENINNLGKTISVKYARDFIKICQNDQLNLKEIAKRIEQNDNPRLPNSTHHKNRLQKLGLISTTLKRQRKKGHKLNYYKSKKIIIIVPEEIAQKIKNDSQLKNEINNIFKFMSIGIMAVGCLCSFFLAFQNKIINPDLTVKDPLPSNHWVTIAKIVNFIKLKRIKREIQQLLNPIVSKCFL